jgi:precorrin-2 dehydrogenase/sirohydrochlorin ferrochelatase
MLPIVLNLARVPVLLAGNGPALRKRLALLEDAGAQVDVYSPQPEPDLMAMAGGRLRGRLPEEHEIAAHRLLFVAGLDEHTASRLVAMGRAHRLIVNAEDVPVLCDFHMPAMVRRGDLLLTISTGGHSPALAATLRAWLAERIGGEWADRLREAARMRRALREGGASPARVTQETADLVRCRHWLDDVPPGPATAL